MQAINKKRFLKNSLAYLPWLVLAFIIYDLVFNKKVHFSIDFLLEKDWPIDRLALLIPVLLLMILNWLLESRKWQLLTADFHSISLKKAFISVLSGVATALFTPNRIGDFIGRLSHIPKQHRGKGMLSSFYGSFSQWLLTIIMGWMAWMQLGDQFVDSFKVYVAISTIYFSIIVILLFLFLSKRKELKYFAKFDFLKHTPPAISVRIKLISLSLFRYLIFTAQFYLLLRLLGVDLSYTLVLSKLGLFYLLTSLVPSTFWGELGIKESVAVWVFSGLIINSLVIVCATLLLWFINLLIPALAGNYFLYKTVREQA